MPKPSGIISAHVEELLLLSESLFLAVNSEGFLVDAAGASERIFDLSPSELIGKTLSALVLSQDHPRVKAGLDLLFMEKMEVGAVFRVPFRKGFKTAAWSFRYSAENSLAWVTVRLISDPVIRDGMGGPSANSIAAARLGLLGEMTASVMHEINNPLAIMTINSQALARFVDLIPEDKRPAAESALDKLGRMLVRIQKTIKSVRALSRQGDAEPFEEGNVRGILDDALDLAEIRFREAGVDLRLKPGPADLKLECRPIQISQVILNLVGNAFDAVKTTKSPWVEVQAEDRKDWVLISVTDSGHGIPKEVAEQIFTPFFTTKAPGMGTGLGLSISNAIVCQHGGSLTLDSRSVNTRFLVLLPKCAIPNAVEVV